MTIRHLGLAAMIVLTLAAAACTNPAGESENVPDIPIYPGAQLREAAVGQDLDPTEYYAIADADTGTVLAWYRDHMPEAGWEPNSPETDTDFVYYHTEEGCYGFVGVFEADDGAVELVVSQQRPGTRCHAYLTPGPAEGDD